MKPVARLSAGRMNPAQPLPCPSSAIVQNAGPGQTHDHGELTHAKQATTLKKASHKTLSNHDDNFQYELRGAAVVAKTGVFTATGTHAHAEAENDDCTQMVAAGPHRREQQACANMAREPLPHSCHSVSTAILTWKKPCLLPAVAS